MVVNCGGNVPDTASSAQQRLEAKPVWVNFLPNPKIREGKTEEESSLGVIGVRSRFISKFIGRLSDGSSSKVVFPGNLHVENVIESLKESDPIGPWEVPVYLRESASVFTAYQVNLEMLKEKIGPTITQLSPYLQERQARLEQELDRLKSLVERLARPQLPERMLAVIDYQNIAKSFREISKVNGGKTPLMIDEIVEAARLWDATPPRNLIKVLIFDFNDSNYLDLYRLWGNRQKFKFCPVQPVPGSNPTDKVIIEQTLALLSKEGLEIERVWLFSGDSDFVPLLDELKRRHYRVSVAAFRRVTAVKLIAEAEHFLDLEIFFRLQDSQELLRLIAEGCKLKVITDDKHSSDSEKS